MDRWSDDVWEQYDTWVNMKEDLAALKVLQDSLDKGEPIDETALEELMMNVEDDMVWGDVDVSADLAERENRAMKVTLAIGAGALALFAMIAAMMNRCKSEQGVPAAKFSEVNNQAGEDSIEMQM